MTISQQAGTQRIAINVQIDFTAHKAAYVSLSGLVPRASILKSVLKLRTGEAEKSPCGHEHLNAMGGDLQLVSGANEI